MKLYLDLILILNFLFDLLLLFTVNLILRRIVSIKRLFLGALLGGLSIFILFFKISSLELFIFKLIISFFMVVITFKYKNLKYTLINLFYLYTTSIFLGGFLYFLNIEFSYKQEGLIFYHHSLSINWIILLLTSPLIIFAYVKQLKNLKNNYSNYYQVNIYFKDGTKKKLIAFLDTGNQLIDPYKKRPIILVNKQKIKFKEEELLLVPYDTLNNQGLLKCIVPKRIDIIGIGVRNNVLLGIAEKEIKIDGVDCILHSKLLEG
jgi:stage II sporulation protein GA (sporulation sigma-E factor processing peptidase)